MEILIVTHKYHNSIGGMEKHCTELVKGLNASTHTTHVISPDINQSKRSFILGVPKKMKRILTSNKNISLIYFNDCLIALLGIRTGKRFNVPMVATAHGLDITFSNRLYQSILRSKLSYLTKIICVSKHTSKKVKKLGINKSKIEVIPNGVTGTDFSESSPHLEKSLLQKIGQTNKTKKIIFCVGRMVKRKGYSWFIKKVLPHLNDEAILVIAGPVSRSYSMRHGIFKKLPAAIKKQLAVIIGFDDEEIKIKDLMSSPNFQNKFVHIGRLSDKELTCMYQLCDICIMPNIKVKGDTEGFGLVALEAGIQGKLVIASKLQGIKDAIHSSQNGWLIPSSKPYEWIKAIKSALSNDELRLELGSRAQAYNKEHFGWEIMTKKYIATFANVASKMNITSAPKLSQHRISLPA